MPLDQQSYNYKLGAAQILKTSPLEGKPSLPDLLSDLILVALEDLEKAEVSPLYHVEMNIWHLPKKPAYPSRCNVCFAGGVMAFSLDAAINQPCLPGHWEREIANKLYALNSVRAGDVYEALVYIGYTNVCWPLSCENIAGYNTNPALFKSQMRDLAGRLAAAGY